MQSSFKFIKTLVEAVRQMPEHLALVRRVNDDSPRNSMIGF